MLFAEEQYAKNMDVLRANPNMQGLVGQLFQYPLVNIQLAPSMIGSLYGQVFDVTTQNWVPVADPNDPMGEAARAVEQLWSPDIKVFTMVGLGLGYAAAAFAQKMLPYQRLVIWDVEAGLFKAMLYAVDVQPLFGGKRVEVFVGNDILARIEPWYLSLDATEKLHMSFPISQSYTNIFQKDAYAAVMTKCMDMLRYHAVGLSTWRMFGQCIGDNDLDNMPEYYANPGYEHLKDLWKGRPAVCLAAGPSLQKNLAQLLDADTRSRVALIAVGTIYGLVHGMGLEPDIVTTIDFQRRNWTDQFRFLPLDPDCPLVYLHSTYPQTVRRWPGPKFVAENASDTLNWIRKFAEGKKSAALVQTVAHLNLMVALELGANPIILMGQDLSMQQLEHHTPGSRAEDLAPGEAPDEAFCDATDFQGKPVKTRHSFLSMLTVFERIIAENPDRTFMNCSEQGMPIRGATHISFKDALEILKQQQLDATDDALDVRPVFQGETSTGLTMRRGAPLRKMIHQTYATYTPKISHDLFAEFRAVQKQVDELLEWALTVQYLDAMANAYDANAITDAQHVAHVAAECMTTDELVEDIISDTFHADILAMEQQLRDRQAAWGLFGIRRFDFLVLMAEIPPAPELLKTVPQQRAYNAGRLVRCARMIEEEHPSVQKILERVGKRLMVMHGTLVPHTAQILHDEQVQAKALRTNALQLYKKGQEFAQNGGSSEATHDLLERLQFQYFRHTQQYEAALALSYARNHFQGKTQKHTERIQRHLSKYRADFRHAFPKYFSAAAPLAHAPTVQDDTGTPWYG